MNVTKKVAQLYRNASKAISDNKIKTLSICNAVGIVATAGVSFKSGMNVQKKIDDGTLTKTDIFKEVGKVGAAVMLTEAAGLGVYKTSMDTIGGLTIAANTARQQYDNFKKQVEDQIGEEKTKELEDEAKKETMEQKEEDFTHDITGYWWWKDEFTGAYFYTKESELYKAWLQASKSIAQGGKCKINDYYWHLSRRDELGISKVLVEEYGWDGEDVRDSKVSLETDLIDRMPDGVSPCRAFRYTVKPRNIDARR